MPITVLTAAESKLLTTRALAQAQIGKVGVDNTIFDELVAAVSDWIYSYTRRFWASENVLEKVAGYDSCYITLSRTPVTTVNSIKIYGDAITDYIIDDANAGILFRERGWDAIVAWGNDIKRHPLPDSEIPYIDVDYVGGFELPSFAVPDPNNLLPAVIQQAANELVALWYNDLKNDTGSNVESVKVGDYSINYKTGVDIMEIPANILMKLRPWVRVE